MTRLDRGNRGKASRNFTPAEYQRIVEAMKQHVGRGHIVRSDEFLRKPELIGIDPRAVADALAQSDGVEYCLYQGDDGRHVAEWYEETIGGTRALQARAETLMERVRRREEFAAAHLPRMQTDLFK